MQHQRFLSYVQKKSTLNGIFLELENKQKTFTAPVPVKLTLLFFHYIPHLPYILRCIAFCVYKKRSCLKSTAVQNVCSMKLVGTDFMLNARCLNEPLIKKTRSMRNKFTKTISFWMRRSERTFDMLSFHKRMCNTKKGFSLFYDFIAAFYRNCCPVACITKRNMPTAINKGKQIFLFLLINNEYVVCI